MSIREKRITTMINKSVLVFATSLAVGLISTLALWLASSTVKAQQPDVVTLMSKALANIPGKEVSMITVEFPPGGADPVHKHDQRAAALQAIRHPMAVELRVLEPIGRAHFHAAHLPPREVSTRPAGTHRRR